jgi:hypothetical protein
MLRPCLVALAATLTAAGCAGSGSVTGTGGNTGTAGNGSGTAGNGGPGTAGNGGPGTAGDTGTGGSTTGTGGSGPTVMPPKNALTDPQPCTTAGTPGPRKIWRLTGPEFAASIHSIFGDTAAAAPITTVFNDPTNLGFSVDANSLLVQDLNASQLEDNAEAVAAWAASAGKLAQFASCASSTSGAPAATCATSFVQAFGRLAFRTTLASTDARVTAYTKLFMSGTSNADGAQVVISAMLQSPYFLYRSELGTETGGSYNLTAFEVASELAYTLTGTTPDSTLLSAADSVTSGGMTVSAMIDAQATRLLAASAPSNSTAVMGFMNGWLGLPRLFTTAKDNTVYQITSTVQNEMATESQGLIMEAFNANGSFGSVLTADHSFLNKDLATFYGLPTTGLGTSFTSVKYAGLSRDSGLLATGTILNGYARPDTDSPTQRGHLVRTRMLCQEISPPPPGLNTTFMPSSAPESTRDHFINEHEQGACTPCHKLMDWIGFAFENYDGWGRYRTMDNSFTVDDSATIYTDPQGQNVNVSGLSGTGGLSAYLAASDDAARCMERYWTYYTYGASTWSQDACTYDGIYSESMASGFGLKSVLMAIIHSPNFTTRVQDQ